MPNAIRQLEDRPIRGGVNYLGPSPVTLVRENTDLEIANTTTETAVLEYTIPANTLTGDRGLRVTMSSLKTNTSGSDANFTKRVKLGATTLYTTGAVLLETGNTEERRTLFDLCAKDSDAEQELFYFETAAIYGSATEDATTELVLQVTVQMSAAHANLKFLCLRYLIEYI